MNSKAAGQVKEIILDEIDNREEDLRRHIPDHTTLENALSSRSFSEKPQDSL